jgi:hypothetical protein
VQPDKQQHKQQHKQCPFCGAHGLFVLQEPRWGSVQCSDCEARGPEVRVQTCRAIQYPGRPPINPDNTGPEEWAADAEARAWAAWNKRHEA